MGVNFRTSLFGGFDREDVINYIEKAAKESQEKLRELAESEERAHRESDELRARVEELRDAADQLLSVQTERDALRAQVAELTERLHRLEQEAEPLRQQAGEYQSLRDHIAEIEISAHRRTEEFRAKAVSRLHELVGEQQNWFTRQREAYSALHQSVQEQFRAAQEKLSSLDLSGLDGIERELEELDRSLDE